MQWVQSQAMHDQNSITSDLAEWDRLALLYPPTYDGRAMSWLSVSVKHTWGCQCQCEITRAGRMGVGLKDDVHKPGIT